MLTGDNRLLGRPVNGFTEDERLRLRGVHSSARFVAECWRIRLAYLRGLKLLPSTKPTAERLRLQSIRLAFRTAKSKAQQEMALRDLLPVDAAELALITPGINPWLERPRSKRVTAALLELENRQTSKVNPQYAEYVVAHRVRRLFDRYGIEFTDYDLEARKTQPRGAQSARARSKSAVAKPSIRGRATRGRAAIVVGVVLGDPHKNVRYLIRDILRMIRNANSVPK